MKFQLLMVKDPVNSLRSPRHRCPGHPAEAQGAPGSAGRAARAAGRAAGAPGTAGRGCLGQFDGAQGHLATQEPWNKSGTQLDGVGAGWGLDSEFWKSSEHKLQMYLSNLGIWVIWGCGVFP